jgi:hypothetical protein
MITRGRQRQTKESDSSFADYVLRLIGKIGSSEDGTY